MPPRASRNDAHRGRRLTIFWVSDAPWHITGYGVTTDYLARRFAAAGHRVYCYAPGAFHGGKSDIAPGVTVLSSDYGDDRWGNKTVNYHLLWTKPDVVITWVDCQGLINYGWTEHPVYMWAPIDTWPVPEQERAVLGRASRILVPSRWGQDTFTTQGIKSTYVPCGIDLRTYDIDPIGRSRWRRQLQPPVDDAVFLIGSVGLNCGAPDRKAYGFEFDAIKAFSQGHKNVRVYIHTNVEGDGMAINLLTLRRELGLEHVICFSRHPGPLGEGTLYMRDMYNAFDVLLHCGISEGFGLPVIEAQGCGTPCVANACTSLTELLGYGSYGAKPLADMLVNTCTRVALPSVDRLVEKLEMAYEDWAAKRIEPRLVRENVGRFDQDRVYEQYWPSILESVPAAVDYAAGKRKLMLGAGKEKKEGFIHHDKDSYWPHIDVAHDLTAFPWPWPDDSWDFVEMSDVLEHLRTDIVQVLDELWRITAPGGYVYLHTCQAGTWQLLKDPTHVQGFDLESFDYFDPDTQWGAAYAYTDKRWRICKRSIDDGGLAFVLQPRKTADIRVRA